MWTLLGSIAGVSLLVNFFRGPNPVWGTATAGFGIGLLLMLGSAVLGFGFQALLLVKSIVVGSLLGTLISLVPSRG